MSTLEQQWRDNVSELLDKQSKLIENQNQQIQLVDKKVEAYAKIVGLLEMKIQRLEYLQAQKN